MEFTTVKTSDDGKYFYQGVEYIYKGEGEPMDENADLEGLQVSDFGNLFTKVEAAVASGQNGSAGGDSNKNEPLAGNASTVPSESEPVKPVKPTDPGAPAFTVETLSDPIDPCQQNPIFTALNVVLILMLLVFSVNFMSVIQAGSTSKIKGNFAIAASFMSIIMAVSVTMQTPLVNDYIKKVMRNQSQKTIALMYPASKKAAIIKRKYPNMSDEELQDIIASLEGVRGSDERNKAYDEYPLHTIEREIETKNMINQVSSD